MAASRFKPSHAIQAFLLVAFLFVLINPSQFVQAQEAINAFEHGYRDRYGPNGEKYIALTFDLCANPGSDPNPDIRNVLQELNVPATFFVSGKFAQDFPDEVRAVASNPINEIQAHTWDHPENLGDAYPNVDLDTQIRKTNEVISQVAGVTPTMMRLGAGNGQGYDQNGQWNGVYNDDLLRAIIAYNVSVVGWDVVSADPYATDANRVFRNVVDNVQNGSIVVMHGTTKATATAEALRQIVPYLREQGYTLVTVSEMRQRIGLEPRMVPVPQPVEPAQDQDGVFVFPMDRGTSDYGLKYTENLHTILGNLGDGDSWTIPANSKVSFNENVGSLNVGHKLANWVGQEVYGAGACDIATWFYYLALKYPGLTASATEDDKHPQIPGVPLENGITIYQPGKDMWIENKTDEDIVIRWDQVSDPNNVKIWVEGTGKSNASQADNALTIIDQTQESLAVFGKDSCTERSSTDWIVWHQIVNSNGEGYWDGVKLAEFFRDSRHWDNSGYGFLLDATALENGTVTIWQILPETCGSYGVGENYNFSGIHIAYVDVPAEAPPNEAQLKTLHLLTRLLMEKYNVPVDHVIAHKETALKDRGGQGWSQKMLDTWWNLPDNKGNPHNWLPQTMDIPAACDDLDDKNCLSILNSPHADPVGLDMDAEREKLRSPGDSGNASYDPDQTTTIEPIINGNVVEVDLTAGARLVALGDNTRVPILALYDQMPENKYCVANGSFWEPNDLLTYRFVVNGKEVTEGEGTTHDVTPRALYFEGAVVRVSGDLNEDTDGDMIVGIEPTMDDTDGRGTTLVGVSGSKVYVMVAETTVKKAVEWLESEKGVNRNNIVQMDGGGSSQLVCDGNTLFAGDGRQISNAIGILFSSGSAAPVEYNPRAAEGDPIRDETQPLAPMWLDSPTIWFWRSDMYRWAEEWDVNPNAIAALMEIESGGWPLAVSRSNARGLLQVVPKWHLEEGETEDMLFDPEFVADKGLEYYNTCLDAAGGDPVKAAACYNGGQSVLQTSPAYWPAETKRYVELFEPFVTDAFAAAEESAALSEHAAGCNRQGGLCDKASDWQAQHPREDNQPGGVALDDLERARQSNRASQNEYNGRSIVIDVPPVVIVLFFLLLAAVIYWLHDRGVYTALREQRLVKTPVYTRDGKRLTRTDPKSGDIQKAFKRVRVVPLVRRHFWGRNIARAVLTVVVILYFPLNFGKIFTAMDTGVMPYRNLVFELRKLVEEKGKPIDQVYDFLTDVKDKIPDNLPLPDSWQEKGDKALETVSTVKEVKDNILHVLTWLGKDPIIVPTFAFVSDKFQELVVSKELQVTEGWSVKNREFESPIVEEGVIVQLRTVESRDGKTNPWGLHGELCYRCSNLKSWLGTDAYLSEGTRILSPITGVVEQVIIDGSQDVEGASIWISSEDVRFAIANVNREDAAKIVEGAKVSAGQFLARPNGPHLHIIVEVRNEDGTWGDYPLVLLLNETSTNYAWFTSVPPYYDTYVPSADDVAKYTEYLLRDQGGSQ